MRACKLSAIFAVSAWLTTAAAGDLPVGAVAPAWSDLDGVDGKKHALTDLDKAPAVVVVFFDNECPDCQNYTFRIKQLIDDLTKEKVAVALISVSREPKNGLEAMKKVAKEKKLTGLYLTDPSQKIGKAYGATVTPEAFVLDKQRRVVYRGAIDDHWKNPKRNHVRLAIQQTLAGEKVELTQTEAQGCFIEYDK